MLELTPACLSCSTNYNQPHSSLGFSGKSINEILEAMIAGDSSNLTTDSTLGRFRPFC